MAVKEREHTEVSLKEHIEKILAEKDKAINIALAAAKEAVQVAETNSEKWRANANEWREAMTDREKRFVQTSEFEEYKKSVDKALALEKERSDKKEGKGAGIIQFIGYVLFILTLIAFLIDKFSLM